MNYFLKFKNTGNFPFTYEGHKDLIEKEGKVIWGQWTSGNGRLNQKTYDEMNKNGEFALYLLDKANGILIKATVERVLRKEEVIDSNLTHLIPAYYNVDTNCSAFYLINKFERLDIADGEKIVNINTNNCVMQAQQVNSNAPWRVKTI